MEFVKEYSPCNLNQMIDIWNTVVDDGVFFPQKEILTIDTGKDFFEKQSFTGIFELEREVVGLYILHPNNVGRCGHIANASYAVKEGFRGKKIGETLIKHSMMKAVELDFRILQFNAVTVTNQGALYLYKKLGFKQLGIIPGGFLSDNGKYIDIIPHYIELV